MHTYLLPGDDGWTLVDTGIGLPDAKETWRAQLELIDGPVARIFVTHFHPDHIGAAADLHELTGAPVYQGALDYAQCELVWANPAWSERLVDWFRLHGTPDGVTEELVGQGSIYRPFIRYQRDPVLMQPGEHLDGWELVAAPGHADGQLCLLKDGILVAADHVLSPISPTVGLWPASRSDPLGDYLESLDRTIALEPEVALPGHGDVIAKPAGPSRRAEGAPPTQARGVRRRPRLGAAERLRALARALGRRSQARVEALRGRRVALSRGAARADGGRRAARGRQVGLLYCDLIVDDEHPPSTSAPRGRFRFSRPRPSRVARAI